VHNSNSAVIECHSSAGFRAAFRRTGGDAPIVHRGGALRWRIARTLEPQALASAFGKLEFKVVKPTDESALTTLADYLRYAEDTQDPEPFYLSNIHLSSLSPRLYKQFRLPRPFESWLDELPTPVRPELCWLFVGPTHSGSQRHIDVLGSSAWNAVFAGTKQWTFIVETDAEGGERQARCEQQPGDLIYTPPCMEHAVSNVGLTVAITGNFVNASNVGAVLRHLERNGPVEWHETIAALSLKHAAR
jgi:histone arginine demethylase JMJD6